jgi:hypothetical protein
VYRTLDVLESGCGEIAGVVVAGRARDGNVMIGLGGVSKQDSVPS